MVSRKTAPQCPHPNLGLENVLFYMAKGALKMLSRILSGLIILDYPKGPRAATSVLIWEIGNKRVTDVSMEAEVTVM